MSPAEVGCLAERYVTRGSFAVRARPRGSDELAQPLRGASHHIDPRRLRPLDARIGRGAECALSATRSSRHRRYALTRSPEDRRARSAAGFRLDLVEPI